MHFALKNFSGDRAKSGHSGFRIGPGHLVDGIDANFAHGARIETFRGPVVHGPFPATEEFLIRGDFFHTVRAAGVGIEEKLAGEAARAFEKLNFFALGGLSAEHVQMHDDRARIRAAELIHRTGEQLT